MSGNNYNLDARVNAVGTIYKLGGGGAGKGSSAHSRYMQTNNPDGSTYLSTDTTSHGQCNSHIKVHQSFVPRIFLRQFDEVITNTYLIRFPKFDGNLS